MNTIRPCGCKGCRSCLQCESEYGIKKKDFYTEYKKLNSYVYCIKCNYLYPGWDYEKILMDHNNNKHENNNTGASLSSSDNVDDNKLKNIIKFPGIYIIENFLTNEESSYLLNNIDKLPWDISQSGRRKQNYGPKTNFKKMKLNFNNKFMGLPLYTKFLNDKFNKISLLNDYHIIEHCTLEYNSNNGSSIDPHIDDCWIWGERILTVNCLGDSILTFKKYKNNENMNNNKYNLNMIKLYKNKLIGNLLNDDELKIYDDMIIRVPMPNLSLIVLYGPARYQFEHCVLREDINDRRVCIAYREFTPMYLNDDAYDHDQNHEEYRKGKEILKISKNYLTNEEIIKLNSKSVDSN